MFDREEIQALVLGARIVAQFGDPALARASESILSKVAGVLPKDLEPLLADTRLFVPQTRSGARSAAALAVAREALVAQRRLRLQYANEQGRRERADRAPARRVLLGQDVDAGRVVRDAHRRSATSASIASARRRSATGSTKSPAARCATCCSSTAPAAVRLLD